MTGKLTRISAFHNYPENEPIEYTIFSNVNQVMAMFVAMIKESIDSLL